MRRAFLVLLLLVSALAVPALAVPALAGGGERAEIFARFEHGEHDRALRRAGMKCVSCHQVGATGEEEGWTQARLAEAFMMPANSTCHDCHAPGEGKLGTGKGMGAATRECAVCHAAVKPPETHAAGWLAMHGADAAVSAATCRDCHTRSSCADCHDRRENAGSGVHDRSWLTVHGIAARAAPAQCDSCHVQAECTSCHSSPAGFGRSP